MRAMRLLETAWTLNILLVYAQLAGAASTPLAEKREDDDPPITPTTIVTLSIISGSTASSISTTDTPSSTASTTPFLNTSSSIVSTIDASNTNTLTLYTLDPASLVSAASQSSQAASSPMSDTSSFTTSHKNLVIILSTVLGVVGIALGIGVLFFLLYRYRHGKAPFNNRGVSPINDDEIASWRGNTIDGQKPPMSDLSPPAKIREVSSSTTSHSAGWTWPGTPTSMQSPLSPAAVPGTPSFLARAPNSRAGLTDETIPGADPFIPPLKRQSSRLSKPNRGHGRSKSRRSSMSTKSVRSYSARNSESTPNDRSQTWFDPEDNLVGREMKDIDFGNGSPGASDLNLPKSIVTRLAKGVLPPNTQIQGNAMLAMSKSATVFVNYLASQANESTLSQNRKTINPADVFKALEDLEFPEFRPRLEAELARFMEIQADKRINYRKKAAADKATGQAEEGDDEEGESHVEGQPAAKKARRENGSRMVDEGDMGDEDGDGDRDGDGDDTQGLGDDNDNENDNEDDEDEDEDVDGDGGGEDRLEAEEQLDEEAEDEEPEDEALDNGDDSD
ncbi:hypothetical protein B7494_g3204 [Chlorociboria aeruginascens]|nr:hypothetical protein B7494_g3204 [Chlorociboria aeruginascens]